MNSTKLMIMIYLLQQKPEDVSVVDYAIHLQEILLLEKPKFVLLQNKLCSKLTSFFFNVELLNPINKLERLFPSQEALCV
eukprot:TRINITY_DN3143_c1_g1_i1.p1 TRINITY_DN3143_c1_g1~~TRINITY_DN3143_c1_g1_i1.p1  ORF type:complete len:80 (+),score=20.37 TRINITY_DN3143_c1_g1_i1:146-385(+)